MKDVNVACAHVSLSVMKKQMIPAAQIFKPQRDCFTASSLN